MTRPLFGEQNQTSTTELQSLLDLPTGDLSQSMGSWRENFPEIVGRSEPMRKILEFVSRVSRSDCAVMIYGESGTGKELIATALHRLSTRSARRFVAINCSAIPENLLESELFGHEKGAFTGAVSKRQGLLEQANGGTLFLDEIGDMPVSLQAKLLRVLQEKTFTPVGGHEQKAANVRIIAATNVDLQEAVRVQKFRLDLYYRLNVIPMELPALRERIDDVPDLLQHFLNISNRVHFPDRPRMMTEEVIQTLKKYAWPGNVRELQNLVERMVVTSHETVIDVSCLPPQYDVVVSQITHSPTVGLDQRSLAAASFKQPQLIQDPMPKHMGRSTMQYPSSHGELPDSGLDLTKYIEDLENSLILQALDRTGNNKNQAAKLLGINRTTLVERLKKRKLVKRGDLDDGPDEL